MSSKSKSSKPVEKSETAGQGESGASMDSTHKEATYVIGIGASAGGLEALERFFRAMPSDTGNAFAVVQHQSPDFKSLMSELLERFTDMPVITVSEPRRIQANHIYIVPPGKEMQVSGDTLLVRDRQKEGVLFLPINAFFRSLASEWGDRTIAIVLSGTGSDGSNGALDVRDAGGVVIAESPETARFDGMPRSVINSGSADAVLAPEEMAGFIANDLPTLRVGADQDSLEDDEDGDSFAGGFPAILDMLRKRYQIDFNFYKPRTIIRRIERRLLLGSDGGGVSLEEYTRQLGEDSEALNQLYKDLLIGVTRFFRDAEAFQVIEKKVIPEILDNLQPGEEVRVWDCGCSTGEEAYSIAIQFLEALRERGQTNPVKVLATDLHESSLQSASQGVYTAEALGEISDEIRKRYFEPIGDGSYRVLPDLRKCIIFTRHNVLNDPPFTKLHMIACRNLLIYLNANAQRQVLSSFQYSLTSDGILFLGASETLGDIHDAFETVERQWKIFRKRHDAVPIKRPEMPSYVAQRPVTPKPRKPTLLTGLYDQLLGKYMPPGVLIGGHNEIMHIFGDVTPFMSQVGGRFTGDLTSLLTKPLQMPLITALRNAEKTLAVSRMHGIRFDDSGALMQLSVEPLHKQHEDAHYFLVLFHLEERAEKPEEEIGVSQNDFDVEGRVRDYIQDLENELQRTRESLQSTVEELETSNEELQASNEELLASNEELQSTNEELHSVNEELYSVNAEHESKILELNQTSSDLKNLMESTDTATLFVDRELHIRLFTPRVSEIFSLMRQDIGRDLRHFHPRIPDLQLTEDIESVMQGGEPVDTYILAPGGKSYLRRCIAYSSTAGEQLGVVINYTDVSEVWRAKKERQESEERFKLILRNLPIATLLIDTQERIQLANTAASSIFGVTPDELTGSAAEDLFEMSPGDTADKLADLLIWRRPEELAPTHRLVCVDKEGERFSVEVRAGYLRLDERPYVVLLVTDIADRERYERNQEAALKAANDLADARRSFLANMSHELRTPLSGLLGFVQLGLKRPEVEASPELQQMFDRMIACGQQLQNVVNDVLEFSRIEDGKLRLHPETVNLMSLLENCINAVRPAAESKQLSLVSDLQQISGIRIRIDPLRLSEVVMNLLSNAVKFTEHGEVILRAKMLGQNLSLEVTDTGIGIPPDQHERIFEPFEQMDASSSRAYGGTGLGLSIARRLVQEFGGTLTLQSVPGEGSTFMTRVPCERFEEAADRKPQVSGATANPSQSQLGQLLSDYVLILVEDDPDNQAVIRRQLEDYGAKVISFNDGQSLLDAPQRLKAEVSVVLMDIQLPGMDGCETAQSLLEEFPGMPIIALTAHAFEEDRERCLAAGMKDHVTKPVQMHQLIRSIRRYPARQKNRQPERK